MRTARKEKLPKGFSYPLGAEAISAALDGIPQLANAEIYFSWRDEFWVSKWRKRIQAKGVIVLLQVSYSEHFGVWGVNVYSVPSEYSVLAREHLRAELARIHGEFSAAKPPPRSARSVVTFNLAEADRAIAQGAERPPCGASAS